MEPCVLTACCSFRILVRLPLAVSLLILAQGINLSAQEKPSIPKVLTDNIQQIIREHEGEWRKAYAQELEQPVLDEITNSGNYLPVELSGIRIGITEQQLTKIRPGLKQGGFGTSFLREAYEFVPGTFTEALADGPWKNVSYRIHRRRLTSITLISAPFRDTEYALQQAKDLCFKIMKLEGKPSTMQVAIDVWGQPNCAALIWKNGKIFIVLLHAKTSEQKSIVTLVVGAEPYYNEDMKYYAFAELPKEQKEHFIRQRYPFLPQVLGKVTKARP